MFTSREGLVYDQALGIFFRFFPLRLVVYSTHIRIIIFIYICIFYAIFSVLFSQLIAIPFDIILTFFLSIKKYWTSYGPCKQHDGQTIQKRRLVAKDRIPASFNRGGLQVPHPDDTAEGLHLNLLQKIQNKIRLPHRYPPSRQY